MPAEYGGKAGEVKEIKGNFRKLFDSYRYDLFTIFRSKYRRKVTKLCDAYLYAFVCGLNVVIFHLNFITHNGFCPFVANSVFKGEKSEEPLSVKNESQEKIVRFFYVFIDIYFTD